MKRIKSKTHYYTAHPTKILASKIELQNMLHDHKYSIECSPLSIKNTHFDSLSHVLKITHFVFVDPESTGDYNGS